MKSRIFLIEFSPELDDGSRKKLHEHVIATCSTHGEAALITSLLREQVSYKKLLSISGKNDHVYKLTAEARQPEKALAI